MREMKKKKGLEERRVREISESENKNKDEIRVDRCC